MFAQMILLEIVIDDFVERRMPTFRRFEAKEKVYENIKLAVIRVGKKGKS